MVNFNQLMKQAQEMQKKMTEMQEKMANMEFAGSSGGGMVNININGKGNVINVNIDPSIINKDDKEMLEDLIVAAFNDAKNKLDNNSSGEMQDMLGGMQLPPGFKMPF